MNGLIRTWFHIRRTPYQSLAALLVMFFNFLFVSMMVFLLLGLNVVLHYFESRPEVSAYLKDGVPQERVNRLIVQLQSQPGVKDVRFVSKEEALKIYQQENKDNPLLLEMVTPDILPASIEVTTKDPETLKSIAAQLEKEKDLFEEIVFQQDIVDSLLRWTRIIRGGGLVVISLLFVVSVVVIAAVVGMKITLKKEEVSVLNLLGASGREVQTPFLLEGISYGLGGALLGWGVCVGGLWYLRPRLEEFFSPLSLWPSSFLPFLGVLGGEVICGLLIGLLASFLAVRKHLRR